MALVKSTYSPSGLTQISDVPDRPDPSEAEREAQRQADRVRFSAMKKEHRWTDEDFTKLQAAGFPARIGAVMDHHGGQESVYSRQQIDTFRARVLDIAALLTR